MLGEQHLQLLKRGRQGGAAFLGHRLQQLVGGLQQIPPHGARPAAPGRSQGQQHGPAVTGVRASIEEARVHKGRCQTGNDRSGDEQAARHLAERSDQ